MSHLSWIPDSSYQMGKMVAHRLKVIAFFCRPPRPPGPSRPLPGHLAASTGSRRNGQGTCVSRALPPLPSWQGALEEAERLVHGSGAVAALTALFMDPELEYTVSELASLARTSVPTAAREVARAEQGGILTTRQVGRSPAGPDGSRKLHLRASVRAALRTFGPVAVVPEVLSPVPGIERVFIVLVGRPLPERARARPSRLDVLVIGQPDPERRGRDCRGREGPPAPAGADHRPHHRPVGEGIGRSVPPPGQYPPAG